MDALRQGDVSQARVVYERCSDRQQLDDALKQALMQGMPEAWMYASRTGRVDRALVEQTIRHGKPDAVLACFQSWGPPLNWLDQVHEAFHDSFGYSEELDSTKKLALLALLAGNPPTDFDDLEFKSRYDLVNSLSVAISDDNERIARLAMDLAYELLPMREYLNAEGFSFQSQQEIREWIDPDTLDTWLMLVAADMGWGLRDDDSKPILMRPGFPEFERILIEYERRKAMHSSSGGLRPKEREDTTTH